MNSALITTTVVKNLNFESEIEGPNVLDLTVTILLLSWSPFQLRDLQLPTLWFIPARHWLQISIIWRCLM
jgi:hypothetical protein